MLSWLLLIVVLAAVVVLGIWVWGSVFGRGEVLPPLDPEQVTEGNERAVDEGQIDDLRFELVPRGYRPEQVDAVILQLHERLQKTEEQLSRLLSRKND